MNNAIVMTPERDVTASALVAQVRDDRVAITPGRFFAGDPTQPADVGWLDDARVSDTTRDSAGAVWCHVDDARTRFRVGQQVTATVDRSRRFEVQRLQTLQHLVWFGYRATHGVADRQLHRVSPPMAYLRLSVPAPAALDLAAVTEWVRQVVADDLPISRPEVVEGTGRHFFQVDGVGAVICSGLNVTRTGTVGGFTVMGSMSARPSGSIDAGGNDADAAETVDLIATLTD